jgi:prevent-host-death family protein
MTVVPVRELRNNTADVLRRVERGEDITISVNGVEVASLVPLRRGKRRSIPRDELLRSVRFADPGLRDDLARLADETTDDLGPIL